MWFCPTDNTVERFVQQSITHLVANGTSNVLDEVAPIVAASVTQSAADMEAMVKAYGLHWTIIRGGAFYGNDTGRDEYWREQARKGELKYPGDGQAYVSLYQRRLV